MKYLQILFLLFIANISLAQDLPNNLLPSEVKAYNDLIYNRPENFSDFTNPPYGPVRTMAEWEPQEGLIIAWITYLPILRQIVDYAQDEGLVYIVCSDSNAVKTYLTSGTVPLVNLRFVVAPFNSIWCRDYGPWMIYKNNYDTLQIADWVYNRPRVQDDAVPGVFASYYNSSIFTATVAPNDLVNTGGNFMVDGNGTGFASKLILNENPSKTPAQIDTIMKKYLGLSRYIKMETLPYDEIHHIDMHIKLLDEETLLVGQYPNGVADGPQIEANLQYVLNNFQTCYGRPYKVIRIPMPPSSGGQYPPSSNYFTYTNSVFVNKTVIVPIYGLSQDTTALRIYREALPGYRIVGIRCETMISALGAIHCITKEVGIKETIFMSHPYLRNTTNTTTPYEVKALIQTKSGVNNAKLYWRTDTTVAYTQVNMTPATADTFKASIPAQPVGKYVYYYISAASNSGKTLTKPLTAPAGYTKFYVDNPSSISNNGTAVSFELKQNYPNPFNPATKISFSIPENGYVKLRIYDVTGREVAKLVNDFKFAGSYTVNFNASSLSSGVYFYKLETNIYNEIKKMLLVK